MEKCWCSTIAIALLCRSRKFADGFALDAMPYCSSLVVNCDRLYLLAHENPIYLLPTGVFIQDSELPVDVKLIGANGQSVQLVVQSLLIILFFFFMIKDTFI